MDLDDVATEATLHFNCCKCETAGAEFTARPMCATCGYDVSCACSGDAGSRVHRTVVVSSACGRCRRDVPCPFSLCRSESVLLTEGKPMKAGVTRWRDLLDWRVCCFDCGENPDVRKPCKIGFLCVTKKRDGVSHVCKARQDNDRVCCTATLAFRCGESVFAVVKLCRLVSDAHLVSSSRGVCLVTLCGLWRQLQFVYTPGGSNSLLQSLAALYSYPTAAGMEDELTSSDRLGLVYVTSSLSSELESVAARVH